MSSNPSSTIDGVSPFQTTTTPNIERANRLISVRSNPGFLDILRISQEIVDNQTACIVDYPGWDKDQMTVLKVRAQCSKEHHQLLLAKINEAIQLGVAEASSQVFNLPEKTAEEAVDQGDFVRQRVLEHFEDQDNRPAGSY